MSDYRYILVTQASAVTTITLNRPAAMNAIHPDMHHELADAFDRFAADAAAFICVVTGAGDRAFCAGSDLKATAEHRPYPPSGYAGLVERWDCPKPIIAAVNGLALGGGFELALACDLIVAAEDASFGLPEPLIGAVALGGGLHRLPRQIGLKPAMDMILTARQVGAAEAQRLGFVNDVVPAADLAAAVARWCAAILKASPMAIRASKETVMRGLGEPDLRAAMANQSAYPAFAALTGSADSREGIRAFVEKRPPVWTGR